MLAGEFSNLQSLMNTEGSCKISCLKDRKQTNVLYLHQILQQQNKIISIIICSDV